MEPHPAIPITDSYWVEPGSLLAGEYPGAPAPGAVAERLGRFRGAGVTLFVDLTEADEPLAPYAHLLAGARHERRPIPDLGVIARESYVEILDLVDAERDGGGCVYVHCWGGIGRTGTVVGCWLVRHGLDPTNAIPRIAELRAHVSDWFVPSPQTPTQVSVVQGWIPGA